MRKWIMAAIALAVASSGVAVGYFLNPTGVPPVKGYIDARSAYHRRGDER